MLMDQRFWMTAAFAICTQLATAADICKYTDADGRTVYSTVPIKNGKKVACFKTAAPPPPPPEADVEPSKRAERAERAVESSPSAKVDSATQAQRDNDRRSILQDELTRERKLLDEAQKRFDEEEAIRSGDERNYQRVLDRLKPFQDRINQHQRNIDSITRELDNLR